MSTSRTVPMLLSIRDELGNELQIPALQGFSYALNEDVFELTGVNERTLNIKNGGIKTAHLGANAVTNAKIANSTITSNKIASWAINTDKLADLVVTSNKIANSAVTNSKIADNAVTADKIADNTVTTDKIADGVVTVAKTGSPNAGKTFLFDLTKHTNLEINGTVQSPTNINNIAVGNYVVTRGGYIDDALGNHMVLYNGTILHKGINYSVLITPDDVTRLYNADFTLDTRSLSSQISTNMLGNGAVTTGKIADEAVTYGKFAPAVQALFSSIFRFKGKVATVSDLPATGNVVGDVWTITADNSERAYIETNGQGEWINLGLDIDLSGYLTSAAAALTYLTIANAASTYQTKLTMGNTVEAPNNVLNIKNKAVSETKLSDSLSDKINMLKAVKASDYVEGNITKNNIRTFLQGIGVNRNSQSVIAAEDITLNFPDCIAYDGVNWSAENIDTWDLTYTIPKGSVFIVSMHDDFCRISFIWLVVADWTVLEIPRSSGSSPKLFWGDLDEKIYLKILSEAYISNAELINQLNNYQKKNIYKENISVALSDWVEEQIPTYADYPYKATITIQGVTVDTWAYIVWGAEIDEVYPDGKTVQGGIEIFASEPVAITIPTIKIEG